MMELFANFGLKWFRSRLSLMETKPGHVVNVNRKRVALLILKMFKQGV